MSETRSADQLDLCTFMEAKDIPIKAYGSELPLLPWGVTVDGQVDFGSFGDLGDVGRNGNGQSL